MDLQKMKFKIVLFGEKGVGCRTLLKNFSMYRDEGYIDTIGAEFSSKTLTTEEYIVELLIWNVNYDEEFRFKLPSFIKNSRGAFLMFDLASVSSFNFISDVPELIRKYAGDIPIWLVGNKLDLVEVRGVSGEEARIYATCNNLMGYMEISANSGQGCEELFEMIANFLYNSHKDLEEKEGK